MLSLIKVVKMNKQMKEQSEQSTLEVLINQCVNEALEGQSPSCIKISTSDKLSRLKRKDLRLDDQAVALYITTPNSKNSTHILVSESDADCLKYQFILGVPLSKSEREELKIITDKLNLYYPLIREIYFKLLT